MLSSNPKKKKKWLNFIWLTFFLFINVWVGIYVYFRNCHTMQLYTLQILNLNRCHVVFYDFFRSKYVRIHKIRKFKGEIIKSFFFLLILFIYSSICITVSIFRIWCVEFSLFSFYSRFMHNHQYILIEQFGWALTNWTWYLHSYSTVNFGFANFFFPLQNVLFLKENFFRSFCTRYILYSCFVVVVVRFTIIELICNGYNLDFCKVAIVVVVKLCVFFSLR